MPIFNGTIDHNIAHQGRVVSKSNWIVVVKIITGALVLAFVLRQADLSQVYRILIAASPVKMLCAVACLCCTVLVNAHRWSVVSASIDSPIPFKTSLIGYFESMFFNQVLPTSIGGDASRVVRAVDAGLPYDRALTGVVIDRAFGLWIVAFSLLLASCWSSSAIVPTRVFFILSVTSAMIIAGSALAAIIGMRVTSKDLSGWSAVPLRLARSFKECLVRPGAALIGLDMVMTTISLVASFDLCAQAIHLPLGLWDAMIILQGLTLAAVVPASIGGWGLREGASVVLFAPLGVSAGDATAVSILYGVVLTAVGLIGAMVWLAAGYGRRNRVPTERLTTT